MTLELNVFNCGHQPTDTNDLCEVNMIESTIHESFLNFTCDDPLEECLSNFETNFNEKWVNEVNALLKSLHFWRPVNGRKNLSLSPSVLKSHLYWTRVDLYVCQLSPIQSISVSVYL